MIISSAASVSAQDAVTTREREAAALKAREQAEKRVDNDMVSMSSLVEALAKNMGQLHLMRTLCFGIGDQKWREKASEMMRIEAANNVERTRQLTRAFNAGYYEEQARHSQCTQAVSVDAAAVSENGRRIATMLGDPYRER